MTSPFAMIAYAGCSPVASAIVVGMAASMAVNAISRIRARFAMTSASMTATTSFMGRASGPSVVRP